MKTMFNKTLIALALTAVAGNAAAATLAATEHTVTKQYLAAAANATETHTAAAFTMTLGSEYVLNDTITLTFNDALTAPASNTIVTAPVVDVVGPPAVAGTSGVTLSLVSSSATSLTYRVTAIDNTGVAVQKTTGTVVTLPAILFTKSKLATNNGVSVTFSAKTNTGLDLDTAGGTARTRSLVKVVEQFTATAPSFAKTIDVGAARKSFTVAGLTGVFNIVEPAAAPTTFSQAVTKVVHEVSGDFSWAVDTDTTTAGIQAKAGVFTVANCANVVNPQAFSATATKITFTCDAVAANTSLAIDVEANKVAAAPLPAVSPVLPTATFTVTSTVSHTNGPSTPFNATAAGSWILNGSTVNVPYMVFGTLNGLSYGQVINVTNNSSSEGNITVDVWKEDGTVLLSNVVIGVSKAKSTTSIAGAIRTALNTAGFGTVDGKVSLRIVTNVPANSVTVYSAYVDSETRERAIVNNDSAVQYKGNAL